MSKLVQDSRKVKNGDTFICMVGEERNGHDYAIQAAQNGASLIITEQELDVNCEVEVVESTHNYIKDLIQAKLKESTMKIIGITGTNGKTTSCLLTYNLLRNIGYNCSYLGTNGYYKNSQKLSTKNTTPSLFRMLEIIQELDSEGYDFLVMEVSSHALVNKRIDGIEFDACVFTNITHEHLDFHKTMENYIKAKSLLFTKLKEDGLALLNQDDQNFLNIYNKKHKTYSLSDIKYVSKSLEQTSFVYKKHIFETSVIHDFNVMNLLVAIKIAEFFGEKINGIRECVKMLRLPRGRSQMIVKDNKYYIVDYAHTPDSVKNVIYSLKQYEIGNIYCIIGCGGNRDKGKRPLMGLISAQECDFVIFTADNPRNEDPRKIIDDMLIDVVTSNYKCIVSRKEAIEYGILLMTENDVLLVLGKGHETYQIIGDRVLHFDDIEEITKFIKE